MEFWSPVFWLVFITLFFFIWVPEALKRGAEKERQDRLNRTKVFTVRSIETDLRFAFIATLNECEEGKYHFEKWATKVSDTEWVTHAGWQTNTGGKVLGVSYIGDRIELTDLEVNLVTKIT